MLSVYICEDNRFHLEKMREAIERCIIINDYDMTVSGTFSSPIVCLSHIKRPLR